MVRKKLIWSKVARQRLVEVLEFFNNRNRSNNYSKKLYKNIQVALKRVCNQSLIGRQSEKKGIHFIIVSDYLIFYKITNNVIEVVTFWDTRQDPAKLVY